MAGSARAGGFCFRCSARDPHHDAGRTPSSLSNPWPLLAPADGLAYTRAHPLIRAMYSPRDLRGVIAFRAERARSPRVAAAATEEELVAFRDWLILTHEFGHLYYLQWTPAKELARTYLAMSYDVIVELMTADRLSDRQVVAAWQTLLRWTHGLAQIEDNIAVVEELVATTIALTTMEMHTQPGGLWAGFGDVLSRIKAEFVRAEEEVFPESGFGALLERFTPLYRLMYGNTEFIAFMMPLLQPITIMADATQSLPHALDARAHLETVLTRVDGCETAIAAAEGLRELEQDALNSWWSALWLQISFGWDETSPAEGNFGPRAALVRRLWQLSRGAFPVGDGDVAAAATQSIEVSRAEILTGGEHLRSGNLVFLQPGASRRRRVIGVEWWSEAMAGPEDVRKDQRELVVLEGLREQLLSGQGIMCPRNPDRASRCRCSLSWRKALLRLARLAQAGAFGLGEWSALPCRR